MLNSTFVDCVAYLLNVQIWYSWSGVYVGATTFVWNWLSSYTYTETVTIKLDRLAPLFGLHVKQLLI